MKLPACLLLGMPCVLAACGADAPDESSIREQSEKLVKQEPGLYRTTTALLAYAVPNASPQDAEMARERMEATQPETSEICLTPEEAARGFDPLIASLQQGDCETRRFVANESELSAQFTCQGTGGVVSDMDLSGTSAPDRANLVVEVEQRGDGLPGGLVQMTLDITMQRIGDCGGVTTPPSPSLGD